LSTASTAITSETNAGADMGFTYLLFTDADKTQTSFENAFLIYIAKCSHSH